MVRRIAEDLNKWLKGLEISLARGGGISGSMG
jgi:hypothetical protein